MGTTAKGYPYPEGTDLVVDGDDAIQALAEAINSKTPAAVATGSVQIANVAADSSKSKTVSFPSGRFTANPLVTLSVNSGSPLIRSTGFLNVSRSSFAAYLGNSGSAQATNNLHWHAIQYNAGSTQLEAALEDLTARITELEARLDRERRDPTARERSTLTRWRETAERLEVGHARALALEARTLTDEADAVVTCPTRWCENYGIAIPVTTHPVDDDGNPVESAGVECGVCGADLTETAQPIEAQP